MIGSEVVIGFPSNGTVGCYVLDGNSSNSIHTMLSNVTVSESSIIQSSNGTVLRFTQYLSEGRFPLSKSSSSATFIYAIGCTNNW